jgi:DNA-binding NtrC family response regulator
MNGKDNPSENSRKLRLLVVDDEPNIVECLKLILALDGHHVVTADSANTALGIFESNQFDVVCTDYSMPGMRGDELAAAIKAIRPQQPVLMITGLAYTLIKPQSVDYIVSKPFAPNDLRQAFSSILAGGGRIAECHGSRDSDEGHHLNGEVLQIKA